MTQGHSATLLIYRVLPGDAFPHSNLHPIQATQLPSQRDKAGRWKGGLAGGPMAPCGRSPSPGSGSTAPPSCQGTQKEAAGLEIRSARPCLVSLHCPGENTALC